MTDPLISASGSFFESLNLVHIALVIGSYVLLLSTSGPLVRHIIGRAREKTLRDQLSRENIRYDCLDGLICDRNALALRDYTGFIIGRCENILVLTFMILGEYTALALVFTAKTVVRAEAIRSDPLYYLAGTMVNVSYSVIIGMVLRALLARI